jgi:hypothetical protein
VILTVSTFAASTVPNATTPAAVVVVAVSVRVKFNTSELVDPVEPFKVTPAFVVAAYPSGSTRSSIIQK